MDLCYNIGESRDSMEITNKLIKIFAFFFVYFLYSTYSLTIGHAIGIQNDLITMVITDILFLVVIVIAYKDNIMKDLKMLKEEYTIGKIFKTIIIWVIALFILNIVMGALTDLIAPGLAIDNNTDALWNMSKVYTVFKTLIFSVVAEELLYRESLRDIIDNNVVFVITSVIIYTLMHFIFAGLPESNVLIYIMIYFIPAILFSLAYIKNKSNIIILMLIKFTYNLIPLAILLLGL